MSDTKISVLCENTAGGVMGITGEHGFSALIEKNGEKILFDTGQGRSLQNNAKFLQVDLSRIQEVVLSHGHYDHTGGLPAVLYPPRLVNVTAHPKIFENKYAEYPLPGGKTNIFIGLGYSYEYLTRGLFANFDLQTEFCELKPGIYYSGQVPRETDFEQPDPHLKLEKQDGTETDPVEDDISLLIETDNGPVVLLGCAHAGMVNILNHFSRKTGHKEFHAVIGGTHLGFFEKGEQLDKSLQALEDYNLDLVAVSHCTGQEIAAICYNRFGQKFAFANAGWSKTF